MNKTFVVYSIAFLILGSALGTGLYFSLFHDDEEELAGLHSHEEHHHHHHGEHDHSDDHSDDSHEHGHQHEVAYHDHHNHGHSHAHGHHHHHHEHSNSPFVELSEDQIKQLGIEVRSAGPGQLWEILQARGKVILHPDRFAHLLPKVDGVVREARRHIGEYVKAGEVLAILESREVAEAKADYLAALSKEQFLAFNLEKEERLYQKGISAEQEFLDAKAAYEEGHIRAHLTKQKLYTLGLDEEEVNLLAIEDQPDLRLYAIRAPIDGVILDRHLTNGEFVESNRTIYKIADLNLLWVDIGIYPKDLAKIREGQLVDVVLPFENRSSPARIVSVSPVIEEESVSARAIAELSNHYGNWCPGTFVKINITTEKVPASLVVPKEAIQTMEGKDYLFTKYEKGFQKKPVSIGRQDAYYAEVLAGLDQEELYAASRTFLLKAELNKNSIEHEH